MPYQSIQSSHVDDERSAHPPQSEDFTTSAASNRNSASPGTTPNTASILQMQAQIGNQATIQRLHRSQPRPAIQPRQAAGRPRIQRTVLKFTNSAGKEVKVKSERIVNQIHSWILTTMQSDTLTTKEYSDKEFYGEDGKVSWDEAFTGGFQRTVQNVMDMYATLKEVKSLPVPLLSLVSNPTTPNIHGTFAPSALSNTSDKSSKQFVDGLTFAPPNLGEDIDGKGIAYLEMRQSMLNLRDKPKHPAATVTPRTDKILGQAHLDLLAGKDITATFTPEEIQKMYYHLNVMMLSEGRRDAAMFVMTPMFFQNMADGLVTIDQAFQTKTVPKKGKKGGTKEEMDESNNKQFPAAWSGSKAPLEDAEKRTKSGGEATDAEDTLIDKMKNLVETFYSDDARRDFSKDPLDKIEGADFANAPQAVACLVKQIRDMYFPTIPAMYAEAPVEEPKRLENRKKHKELKKHRGVLKETHKSIKDKKLDYKALEVLETSIGSHVDAVVEDTSHPRANHNRKSREIGKGIFNELKEWPDFEGTEAEDLEKQLKTVTQEERKKKRRKSETPAYKQGQQDHKDKKSKTDKKDHKDKEAEEDYKLGFEDDYESIYLTGYIDGATEAVESSDHGSYIAGYKQGQLERKLLLEAKSNGDTKAAFNRIKNAQSDIVGEHFTGLLMS